MFRYLRIDILDYFQEEQKEEIQSNIMIYYQMQYNYLFHYVSM